MGKYISFGKYNKLYKYIWIVVSIRLIVDYLYTENFPGKIRPKFLDTKNFPPSYIIEELFIYITTMLLSIIIFKYELKQNKIDNTINNNLSQLNSMASSSIIL